MTVLNNKIVAGNDSVVLDKWETDVSCVREDTLSEILMTAIANAKNQEKIVEIAIWDDSFKRDNGLGRSFEFFEYFKEEMKEWEEDYPDEPFGVVYSLDDLPADTKYGCVEIWIDKKPVFHSERCEYSMYNNILNFLKNE